jgi:hypothetical protein
MVESTSKIDSKMSAQAHEKLAVYVPLDSGYAAQTLVGSVLIKLIRHYLFVRSFDKSLHCPLLTDSSVRSKYS